MLRKALVYSVSSLFVPTACWFVNADLIGRIEVICRMVVEVLHKGINQHPSRNVPLKMPASSGPSGWRLLRRDQNRSSDLSFDMPVKSNCGACWYFDHAVVCQKELEVTNSKFVVRISMPNNFNNTLSDVSNNSSLFNWQFIHSTISRNCFGGNIRRKNPSATYLVLLPCCAGKQYFTNHIPNAPHSLWYIAIQWWVINCSHVPLNAINSCNGLTRTIIFLFCCFFILWREFLWMNRKTRKCNCFAQVVLIHVRRNWIGLIHFRGCRRCICCGNQDGVLSPCSSLLPS